MDAGRKKLAAAVLVVACLALLCVTLIPSNGSQDGAAADQDIVLSAGEEMLTPAGQEGSSDQSFTDDEMSRYSKNMDIWFMLMLVAFLMIFIRKFEWGVALATLLVTAGSFLAYGDSAVLFWRRYMGSKFDDTGCDLLNHGGDCDRCLLRYGQDVAVLTGRSIICSGICTGRMVPNGRTISQ